MQPNYKYKKISDFRKHNRGLYNQLVEMNLVDKLCFDMGWKLTKQQNNRKIKGYWQIKENCFNEAKKHNDYTDFRMNANPAYLSANKNGWLLEICDLLGWDNLREYASEQEHKYFIIKTNSNTSRKYRKIYKTSELKLHSTPHRIFGYPSEKEYFKSII